MRDTSRCFEHSPSPSPSPSLLSLRCIWFWLHPLRCIWLPRLRCVTIWRLFFILIRLNPLCITRLIAVLRHYPIHLLFSHLKQSTQLELKFFRYLILNIKLKNLISPQSRKPTVFYNVGFLQMLNRIYSHLSKQIAQRLGTFCFCLALR